jgi:hypothetical protein
MSLLNPFSWGSKKTQTPAPVLDLSEKIVINNEQEEATYKEAFMNLTRGGVYGGSYVLDYDGEKNLGGIGPVTS